MGLGDLGTFDEFGTYPMSVLRNAADAPAILTNTGKFEETIFGAALEDEERGDERN